MSSAVHYFAQQLEYSSRLSDEPAWQAFYRRLWPDMVAAVQVNGNVELQRHGVDRIVIRANGQQHTVDEKKRNKDYGDLLIEEVSQFYGPGDQRNKPGWSLDTRKRCDYIAYAVPTKAACFWLPFDLTRRTCIASLPRWKNTHGVRFVAVRNEKYMTHNWAVPWALFKADFERQLYRKFEGELPLPTPQVVGAQLDLSWPK